MAGCLSTFLQLTSQDLAHDPARPNTKAHCQLGVGFGYLGALMHKVVGKWGEVIRIEAALVPVLVPIVVRTMLPLVQQLQRCCKLLPARDTAAGAAAGMGESSSGGSASQTCSRQAANSVGV
jgi:hypothetical protein